MHRAFTLRSYSAQIQFQIEEKNHLTQTVPAPTTVYNTPYWWEYANMLHFMPHGAIMFHTTWCELDMSCLKDLKQVRFGLKPV